MKLSVIIVNYNVKYFLEQCLHSVTKAGNGIDVEILVVDNCSVDESLPYLQNKFPTVRFIQNKTNGGFSNACNLGFKESSGGYILFLNPDTIVAEDSFTKCIRFFETTADCGALGVRMIDGSGRFLKESKRSFPSPLTSLFKLAGFSRLFPTSRVFSRYHLGHLDKNQNHEVDVLAGAFLMTKREVLEKVGSFDEDFFMYGEDVDLSYRIQEAGYKNYYFSETTIIHFKGESTRRGSLNYVRLFYQAMMIFVNKHYTGAVANVFNFLVHIGIWTRAIVTLLLQFIRWIGLPAVDALITLSSFWAVKELWSAYVRTNIVYPDKLLFISFPVFTLLYLTGAYYAGLYDRYYKSNRVSKATIISTIAVLSVYALLPEQYRFSRGIIVFGALLAFLLISLQRYLLAKAGILLPPVEDSPRPHILIAATKKEYDIIQNFLRERGFENRIIGRVGINGNNEDVILHLDNIEETAEAMNAKELIFYAGTLSYKRIIELTESLHTKIKFRYHAGQSTSIVGSDTSTQSGEILSEETDFAIDRPSNKRMKRLTDVVTAAFFLITFPVHLLFVKRPLHFIGNCFAIILGKKTWIGYVIAHPSLPGLRKSVLAPNGKKEWSAQLSQDNLYSLHYWYARNYEPLQDMRTIFTHYKYLGS